MVVAPISKDAHGHKQGSWYDDIDSVMYYVIMHFTGILWILGYMRIFYVFYLVKFSILFLK